MCVCVGRGGTNGRAGLGWQTKGATRRCRDGASAFTVAEGHERWVGTEREGSEVTESLCQSPKHTRASMHVHTTLTLWLKMSWL